MILKTKMEKIIHTGYKNMGAMLVSKNGKIVYENYYNGSNKETTFHVFSVTKSIIAILMGIAIDKGYLQDIDQKLLDFFPEYTVKKGENTLQHITVKDLLTMTAPYKYQAENFSAYFTSNDWVKASLDLLGGRGKIGEFRYAPIIGPDILSGILVQVTGESVLDFATKYLFNPLGIKVDAPITFGNKEEQMAFYKAKNVKGWVASPTGVNTAGWGLNLTASDMLQLGQLYLNQGRYEGKQIVSEKWVAECIKEQVVCKQYNLSYGYLWWVIDKSEQSFAAMGDGGNVIYVNLKKQLVIAIASYFISNAKDCMKLIKGYIEPVFE